MQMVSAGVPLSFEATFDADDLFVGMEVYDVTGDTPEKVGSTLEMSLVAISTYAANFTPENGKNYVLIKSVYTNDTLTVVDSNYQSQSESIRAVYMNQSIECDAVGFVFDNNTIIGFVTC